MQNQMTAVNSFTRRLQVEVPWDELQDRYAVFLRKFIKKVRLPGFRKGKVPEKLVRRQFGAAAEAEFAEQAVQDAYLSALKDSELDPINQATIRGVQFHEGAPLRFEAAFEVEPDVKLPTYKRGMKFQQVIFDIDDEDVARAVEDLRQQHAQLRTVEDGIEEGHYITADMQEMDASGMPLIGRKLENQYLLLDPEGPLGAASIGLLQGAKAGDTRRVSLTADGGGEVLYDLTVKEVTERSLPEVDDAFARQVDPQAEDVEQLKANLWQKIESAFQRESVKRLSHDMADYFVRSAQLEVPTSLFENYLDTIISDLERGGYRGGELDREAMREEHKASIAWNLKWFLLRKQLIAEEEIAVGEEAVSAHIQGLVEADESQANQIRNHYRRPENRRSLEQDLIAEALSERLKSYAKIKVVHKPSSDLRKGA